MDGQKCNHGHERLFSSNPFAFLYFFSAISTSPRDKRQNCLIKLHTTRFWCIICTGFVCRKTYMYRVYCENSTVFEFFNMLYLGGMQDLWKKCRHHRSCENVNAQFSARHYYRLVCRCASSMYYYHYIIMRRILHEYCVTFLFVIES